MNPRATHYLTEIRRSIAKPERNGMTLLVLCDEQTECEVARELSAEELARVRFARAEESMP